MRRSAAAAFGAALLMTVSIAPAAVGGVPVTFVIQTGAFYDTDAPAVGNNFYPEEIDVHPSDSLEFVSPGFHTATLIPVNEDPDVWLTENASPGGPFSLVQPDPDDGAHAFKYNVENLLLPSSFDCGTTSTPCAFNGSDVVHSGIPLSGPMDFTTRLDVPAGSSVWVICQIHPSTMRMHINVVPELTEIQSQSSIDSAAAAAQASEKADAEALHQQLLNQHSSHFEGGRRVWDMHAGYDTPDFALMAFYPARQEVKKGQLVEWHFGSLMSEDHTVSLSKSEAIDRIVSKDFLPKCDRDTDAGSAPDDPPDLEGPPFCNDPSQLEVDASTKLLLGTGSGQYKGAGDLESAAVRGANISDAEAYQVSFPRDLDKTVKYICSLHPFMLGKIVM